MMNGIANFLQMLPPESSPGLRHQPGRTVMLAEPFRLKQSSMMTKRPGPNRDDPKRCEP
jgi:hypothetical protein